MYQLTANSSSSATKNPRPPGKRKRGRVGSSGFSGSGGGAPSTRHGVCLRSDSAIPARVHSGCVDPLVLIMTVIIGGLLVWLIFLGLYHPRSGADVLQWRPTRSPELEAQNEVDDLEQMLQAANDRRRARGEAELTEEMLQARVLEDRREQSEMRAAYLADSDDESEGNVAADIAQMLARVNEGRRRRGEPEWSLAEYRARLDVDSP